jgi:FkbM family methyltransferase
VFTFEPSTEALEQLEMNVRINGLACVTLRPVAVGAAHGRLKLVFDDLMSGGASGDPEIVEQLAPTATRPRVRQVEVPTIDREIEVGLPVPDFVKVDVERMEYDVLRGMENLLSTGKPWVYIEHQGATSEEDKLANVPDFRH